jgi:hypothetical protein
MQREGPEYSRSPRGNRSEQAGQTSTFKLLSLGSFAPRRASAVYESIRTSYTGTVSVNPQHKLGGRMAHYCSWGAVWLLFITPDSVEWRLRRWERY